MKNLNKTTIMQVMGFSKTKKSFVLGLHRRDITLGQMTTIWHKRALLRRTLRLAKLAALLHSLHPCQMTTSLSLAITSVRMELIILNKMVMRVPMNLYKTFVLARSLLLRQPKSRKFRTVVKDFWKRVHLILKTYSAIQWLFRKNNRNNTMMTLLNSNKVTFIEY